MKLHLGCGWRDFGNEWIHIDGGDYKHVTHHNITQLPFGDDTADVIYASHVLSYFDRLEVVSVLTEWHRVLKSNGILRVAVPDFEVMSKLYSSGIVSLDHILGPMYGKMSMGETKIYHKTTYDFNSLSNVFYTVGFKSIKHYDWRNTDHYMIDDHSQAYIPHMDKDNGVLISLNVEAIKI